MKNIKRKIIACCLVMGLIFTSGCSNSELSYVAPDSTTSNNINVEQDPENMPENEPETEPQTEAQTEVDPEPDNTLPEPVSIDLISVGDDLIHSRIYKQANARAGGASGEYDWTFAYENIAETIATADFATINQESMMSSEHSPSSYPMFNSPQSLGDHLIDIGFDFFNLANNHMLDVGEKGLLSTLDFFTSKEPEVLHAGAYYNEEEMMEPTITTVNDITMGFVSLTQLTNGLSLPSGTDTKIMLAADTDLIKEKIETTKAVSDIVIVNVHWGEEYMYTPNSSQTTLAEQMVEWGADIIIGHHPHVLQPIEYIEKDDGTHALVVYSLGNFISTQDEIPRTLGGMVHYTITKDYETGLVDVTNPQLEPIVTHYGPSATNVQIYKLADYTSELASQHGLGLTVDNLNNLLMDIIPAEFLTDYSVASGRDLPAAEIEEIVDDAA